MRGGAVGWGLLSAAVAGVSVLVACAPADRATGPTERVPVPSSTTAVPTPALVATTLPRAAEPMAPVAASGAGPRASEEGADGRTHAQATAETAPETRAPATTETVTTETGATETTPATIRLVFTGDVLMHSPLWRQALDNGGGVHDFTPMFEHVRPIVESADLAVCHLETPIAPPFEPYSTSPRYGVPAEVVDGLASVGFDHCSTASNHTFDRGVAGVDATVARFAQQGMTQHGMATTPAGIEPVLLDVGGVRIAHVAATYGYDGANPPAGEPWRSNRIDVDRLLADARSARERGADVVILSLHWGNSNAHRPTPAQRRTADLLEGSGLVDLVVGHHAHVVQPVEEIGEMWVAWGLGNFVSNMPLTEGPFPSEETRDGLVLEVVLAPQPDGTVPITQVVARPIWVDQDAGWVVRDVATALADHALVARIGADLEASWQRTAPFVPWLLPDRPGAG